MGLRVHDLHLCNDSVLALWIECNTLDTLVVSFIGKHDGSTEMYSISTTGSRLRAEETFNCICCLYEKWPLDCCIRLCVCLLFYLPGSLADYFRQFQSDHMSPCKHLDGYPFECLESFACIAREVKYLSQCLFVYSMKTCIEI